MTRLPAAFVTCLVVTMNLAVAADPSARFVYPDRAGRLVYDRDDRGNRIPDFSHCGYLGGGARIPDVPVRVTVPASEDDNGLRIQQAIDYVSRLPADNRGTRGAVLLLSGRHLIAGQIRIAASGVILRGQGTGPAGTVLVAMGLDRRALIRVQGTGPRQAETNDRRTVADDYVSVGSETVRLEDARGLRVGDSVLIEHPGTQAWIHALEMDRFPSRDSGSWLDWRPGTLDLHWDRSITMIEGNTVTLDAPLTSALDRSLSRSSLVRYTWPGRMEQIGIEDLRCESTFNPENRRDEQHAWDAISIDNVQDAWVRQVTAAHFAGSAVALWEGCRRVTVEDCVSLEPVSEPGGHRRRTFYTSGQLTLFQRCRSEQGCHAFAVGYLAAGPNAFVDCQAIGSHQFSGPIESWASGVLFDNVDVDGGGLALTNRETAAQGVGWAAANCVLWQCTAPVVVCRMPPAAQNWAIGCWGEFVGNGHWRSLNEFVKPDSLYRAQLLERLGGQAVANVEARAVRASAFDAPAIGQLPRPDALTPNLPAPNAERLYVKNGWLVIGDRLVAGKRLGTVWWRGSVLPSRAGEFGVGVTRFVPGRFGPGFTDDLSELTDSMRRNGQAVLEHHWGLWYDRRRDDHQMIRRIDGEVWAPFYEQPWARSGQGQAWDGLSKYDLTRFNPWYFARLKAFADLCDQKGLVLIQQMYFQHNLLEAGAHWADFPWRPANCLQDTGFPEPPGYENRKRVFMAADFYDASHPIRRELHRAYIRHCLDVLGHNSNVIFGIGEEFTGPRAFAEFWLDTISEWQRDTGRDVLVSLGCTKDVQDAILADPERRPTIDLIDLKYWWYSADGELFAPRGGDSLAPRQQLRERPQSGNRSPSQTARQIREYRQRFPEKAILCSIAPTSGWLALAAGSSIPGLSRFGDRRLFQEVATMRPLETEDGSGNASSGSWMIGTPGESYLAYITDPAPIRLDLTEYRGVFESRWIDPASGQVSTTDPGIRGGRTVELKSPISAPIALWFHRLSAE